MVLCIHVHYYATKTILQFQLCKNFCDYKLFIKISNSPLLNSNYQKLISYTTTVIKDFKKSDSVCSRPWKLRESMELQQYSFSSLDAWLIPCISCFNTGKTPGTHSTGGWVGLGAILDGCRKSHTHQGSNPKLSSPYQVTRSNCDHIIIFLHKCRLGQIDTDAGKVQVSSEQCPKEGVPVFTFIN